MKNNLYGVLAVMILVLSSCVGQKSLTADDQAEWSKIKGVKWQLIELAGKSIAGKVNDKMPYLEFLTDENRYVATGGCNTMNGEFQLLPGRKIKFTVGISTMMACEDMESDRALANVFKSATTYSLENGILSISNGSNPPLARFKVALEESALVGTWELDYIAGLSGSLDEAFVNKKPTLIFEKDLKKASGNGGCNRFSSQIELKESAIQFKAIMSTKMACQGNAEPLFFQSLEKVNVYSIKENTLTLIQGDIAILRFKKI